MINNIFRDTHTYIIFARVKQHGNYMLKSLYIKNFAIIQEQKIQFKAGLNVLLGETGAGKSLIISALNIVSGSRASTEIIRKDEKKCVIEATFYIEGNSQINHLIEKNALDTLGHELILRREINSSGNSRAFINDSPAQLKTIKEFADVLVDYHGQHDSHSLLSQSNHVNLLDLCGVDNFIIKKYEAGYKSLKEISNKYYDFRKKELELKEREQLVRFKLEEILAVDPKPDEMETLEKELEVIENAEFLKNTCYEINYNLYNSEGAIIEKLQDIQKRMIQLSEYNEDLSQYTDELETNIISLKEINNAIADYKDDIHADDYRANEIRKRMVSLKSLQKKFGPLNLLIESIPGLQAELDDSVNFSDKLEEMLKQIKILQKELGEIDVNLSEERKKTFSVLKSAVENTLIDLGIKNPVFEIKTTLKEASKDQHFAALIGNTLYIPSLSGVTHFEFYISTNLGETPKPLSEVASGGEISRIMLAIKSHIAQKDNLPLMVFDEIDTGISGQIAKKVADRMKLLSKDTQMIVISHQAQLTALADTPIFVSKLEENGNTYSNSAVLSKEDLLTEVAKMLGGDKLTENIIQTAKELTNY